MGHARALSLVATYSDPVPSFATTKILEGPRVQKQTNNNNSSGSSKELIVVTPHFSRTVT